MLNKMKSILKNKKGETLIETVIAFAVFGIMAAALLNLLITITDINKNAHRLNEENARLTAAIDGNRATTIQTNEVVISDPINITFNDSLNTVISIEANKSKIIEEKDSAPLTKKDNMYRFETVS